jgi:Holliday junction DNA helicase RuvB
VPDTPIPDGADERLVDPAAHTSEEDPSSGEEDTGLRPTLLRDFVGQPDLRSHLDIVLGSAKLRGASADHLLFAGPPGLGKTTLAGIVANEMESSLHITSGPAIERPGDLAALLTRLEPGDVMFVDEIHRLSRAVEEVLYPAMEDFEIDVVLGKGPDARSVRIELPAFTLVGATTRTGLITGPLRDRFGFVARLDYYSPDDLAAIVERAGRILGIACDPDGAREIAGRSRGTPRIANRLLRRVRDYALMRADGVITADVARDGLAAFGVDHLGLDRADRAVLDALCRLFDGGPVGLSTLAIGAAEPTETVEDVHEPFLIAQGLLLRTPRGRVATRAAWDHLGLTPPATAGGQDAAQLPLGDPA